MYENPLVSVIVPVYNTEKFIQSCLKSIVNQTYKNIELIVINDGSIDKSLEEINKMNIPLILHSQSNKGLSATRNKGIKLARGKYLFYVDSDDMLFDRNTIAKLVEYAETYNADIVTFNYKKFINYPNDVYKTVHCHKTIDGEKYNVFYKDEIRKIIQKYNLNNFHFFSWKNFIKKELLTKNNILFSEELESYEDGVYNLYTYNEAEIIVYVEDVYYYYRENPLSITQKYDPKLLQKLDAAYLKRKEFFMKFYPQMIREEEDVIYNLKHTLFFIINNKKKESNKSLGKSYLNELEKTEIGKDILKSNLKVVFKSNKLNIKHKLLYLLIKLRFRVFVYLILRNI